MTSHPISSCNFHLYTMQIDLLGYSPEEQREYFTEREDRSHDLPVELKSLDDISGSEAAVREPFQHLCELAYHGVLKNKVTFSSSDLPLDVNTLSLLQGIESFFQCWKSIYFTLHHTSFQEVLAAHYMATCLSDSEQASQFKPLFDQPHFSGVFQFYSTLQTPGIKKVIARIVKMNSKSLLVSLIHCLYEAQDPSLCHYVAERLDKIMVWFGSFAYFIRSSLSFLATFPLLLVFKLSG